MKKSQSIRVIAAHRLVFAAAAEPRRGGCGEKGKHWSDTTHKVEKVGREMSAGSRREGRGRAGYEVMWMVLLEEYQEEQNNTWLRSLQRFLC